MSQSVPQSACSILLVLALVGAVMAEQRPPSSVAAKIDDAPRLAMIVEAKTREGIWLLEPGEMLRSGDRIALRIEVDRPAYVYVLGSDPSRKAELLFPASGHTQLRPGGTHRIPLLPDWIELDKIVGRESLFVIASLSPLEREILLQRVQHSGPDAKSADDGQRSVQERRPRGAPVAILTGVQYRSLDRVGVVRGLAVAKGTSAKLSPDGSAMIQFDFQHQ